MHKINHANIKEWAANYDGPLFDGILCDPPYELGFMGKSWDSSGIAFDVEMWADLLRILKPGGHLLAFSGSRTYHRMACAIEDAGFEIRDMIEWVYGSGFPKSLDVSKAIDKAAGAERDIPRSLSAAGEGYDPKGRLTGRASATQWCESCGRSRGSQSSNCQCDTTGTPATPDAERWQGYGTALKPAHEPCVLARKPIEGTVANNVLKYGTGGLNIDGTRIAANPEVDDMLREVKRKPRETQTWEKGSGFKNEANSLTGIPATGRFPANLIHDGSDEVKAVFPDSKSSPRTVSNRRTNGTHDYGFGTDVYSPHNDSGNSSRFFYTAKASKSERNAGLEGFEEQITNDGRKTDIDNAFQRGITERKNHHPTVKPLSLTKYLATLIKPPTGGRLLVPFSGSGSEMIGALQAGWEYVEGVELTEEYIPIAEARIKHWVSL